MLACGAENVGSSQLKPLTVTKDLDLALADLVGDLAAYRPGGKGLIFEGGGDSEFDRTFVSALFSEEVRGINLISGANKVRVKALYEILERAYEAGDLPTKFYAVVDADTGGTTEERRAVNRFEWKVYHIENYLLEPAIIADVLNSLALDKKYDEKLVLGRLSDSARLVVSSVLIHKMRTYVNANLVSAIDLGFSPATLTPGRELHGAVARSTARINAAVAGDLSENKLLELELKVRNEIEQSFADGTWLEKLPGRDILHRFISSESVPVAYEVFRNLIVSRMKELGYKPPGMKEVIEQISRD
jgi:hypothetical protein